MKTKDKQIAAKNYLDELYPNPTCELNFSSAFELLVAVILSAQCTDARVNQVTKVLFQKYNNPQALANADVKEIERIIYSCGFYHNKARNIIDCSKDILKNFGGEVPSTREELVKLAGVGRKTANVVFSLWFKGDAIAVDTHVFRISNRIPIGEGKTPEEVENSLMKNFEQCDWSKLHYQLVLFGRYKCKSKNPECETCKLKDFCKYYNSKR